MTRRATTASSCRHCCQLIFGFHQAGWPCAAPAACRSATAHEGLSSSQ
jgi:hypothetical protein